ncbi:MAG: TonB-dependent receptor plug domain-containing protein [Phycisphaerae bacterium]
MRLSGARSLFELLDIYVPNLVWLRNHFEGDSLGLRGIIGDRNDKFLLLVNGLAMNQKTHAGAMSELDTVMLGDIHHIDVVRGPGSAMYGPGAVSMVINIITFSSDTFQGTEVIARTGAIEEFYSTEVRHGFKFKDGDGGIFLYAGVADYIGASTFDAPQIYPSTFSTHSELFDGHNNWWPPAWGRNPITAPAGALPGDGIKGGEPATGPTMKRDEAAARSLAPLKLYTQMKKNNWDIWARYTRGGKARNPSIEDMARVPWGYSDWHHWSFDDWSNLIGSPISINSSFYSYQQATVNVGYKQELSEALSIDYAFRYGMTDFVRYIDNSTFDASREDQYYAKTLLHWQPNEKHKFAFGLEYTHMELGLKPIDWAGHAVSSQQTSGGTGGWKSGNAMPQWGTNMYSALCEWQWNINDEWTTFVGARVDKHTFTDYMFSPRTAIIYTPNKRDTWKLMWSQSVRANFEENMKKTFDTTGKRSNPEKLDSIELRYERQQNNNLDLAASIFVHYKLEAIAWSGTQSDISGTQREYGVELEAAYHTEKTRLTISHSFTQLYGYFLASGQSTAITAKPYGYGNDLTNWPNHITKITFQHKLDEKWTFDASFRVYCGFPGMKDYDKYNPYATTEGTYTGYYRDDPSFGAYGPFPVIGEGWERTYRGSYFLNLGLQYKPSKNLTIGVNGYNLLGIFNADFNKRNYVSVGNGAGDFRSAATAVAVTVAYTF